MEMSITVGDKILQHMLASFVLNVRPRVRPTLGMPCKGDVVIKHRLVVSTIFV